jgi:hypothetical protein
MAPKNGCGVIVIKEKSSDSPNRSYDYSLYPNPATTLLNFDFETEKTVVIYSEG